MKKTIFLFISLLVSCDLGTSNQRSGEMNTTIQQETITGGQSDSPMVGEEYNSKTRQKRSLVEPKRTAMAVEKENSYPRYNFDIKGIMWKDTTNDDKSKDINDYIIAGNFRIIKYKNTGKFLVKHIYYDGKSVLGPRFEVEKENAESFKKAMINGTGTFKATVFPRFLLEEDSEVKNTDITITKGTGGSSDYIFLGFKIKSENSSYAIPSEKIKNYFDTIDQAEKLVLKK